MWMVKFKDGKYGIKKFTFTGWAFLDLNDYSTWRHFGNGVITRCRGSYVQCATYPRKMVDSGSRIQRAELRTKMAIGRIFTFICAILFSAIGLSAVISCNDKSHLILYIIFSLPVYYLIYRGATVEENVLFIDTGWDK